ncbi:MAG TPA: glycosyltransferase family 1 protein [Chryseosolibacter sp.]
MKIGIEVQRLFRANKFGIEVSALELIKKLREIEPRHQYVVFAKDDEDRGCLTPSDNLEIKIVSGGLFADFEQFFLPIAAAREQVDVLHCTGNTAPYFSRVPVIQTLHDVIFMDAIPGNDTFYQRFGNRYRRSMVPLVTPRSKAIITVSEHEKGRILERLTIDPNRVHVVYNGIDAKRFHPSGDAERTRFVRAKYRLPEHYILFLGNTSVRKNAAGVLEAYARYAAASDAALPLVTPGLPEKFITDKLRELDIAFNKNQFITPGYIDDADLPLVYGLSTMFLFPSLSEGFGMPVLEAMASATPVITSSISSMPEIAGDAAILVDPLKPEDICGALLMLSGNDALRKKKIAEGMTNVKRFSWERTAEQVLSLYEAVYLQNRAVPTTPGLLHRPYVAKNYKDLQGRVRAFKSRP